MRSLLILFSVCAATPFINAQARTYTFDSSLLKGEGKHADIRLLEQGLQTPGEYFVNVTVNRKLVDVARIRFFTAPDGRGFPALQPCLSRDVLMRYGIRTGDYRLTPVNDAALGPDCISLDGIPHASAHFDFSAQTLALSIPQAALQITPIGISPVALWDEGINAMQLDYRADISRRLLQGSGPDTRGALFLQPGINLGAWRFRHLLTLNQTGQRGEWQNPWSYAERGIISLKSRITLGDSFSRSDVLDSLPLRGVFLGSDERMLSLSEFAYAPVIRGIARSQARIDVRQAGYLLYSLEVAPGPFALENLFAPATSGDIDVTVLETDGQPQHFTVPYQRPAIAIKEGYLKYSLAAGQYRREQTRAQRQYLMHGEAIYGLPRDITVYGGLQLAQPYQAFSSGTGLSLGHWGAFSLDATHARGRTASGASDRGNRIRGRYSKQIQTTNSALSMTLSGFSARYRDPGSVLDNPRTSPGDGGQNMHQPPVSRLSLTFSQGIGEYTQLNLSAYRNKYRNNTANNALNLGLSIPLGGASLGINWLKRKSIWQQHRATDHIASLSLSLPLARFPPEGASLVVRTVTAAGQPSRQELGLQGYARQHQLSWGLRQQYDAQRKLDSSLQGAWSGRYGQFSGNYQHGRTTRQLGITIAGGIVAHAEGITAGQSLRDTAALVSIPGVAGLQVGGFPGLSTDYRGYTLRPGLVPYQDNIITVNPVNLPGDAEIAITDRKVVPTAGAVLRVPFAARQGGRAMMRLTQATGKPVPFGAIARMDGADPNTGIVGEGGMLYLTGLAKTGTFTVSWPDNLCRVHWTLPENKQKAGLYEDSYDCR